MKSANATLILVSYNLYGKTLNRTFTELKNLVSLTSVLLCDIWNGLKLKFWQTYKDKNTNKRKFTSREIISHKTTVCFCTVFSLFLRPHRIFVISKLFVIDLKEALEVQVTCWWYWCMISQIPCIHVKLIAEIKLV